MKLNHLTYSAFLCAVLSSTSLAAPASSSKKPDISTSPNKPALALPTAEIPVITSSKDGTVTQSIARATVQPEEAFETVGLYNSELTLTATNAPEQTQDPLAGNPKPLPSTAGRTDTITKATTVTPTPIPSAEVVAKRSLSDSLLNLLPNPVIKRQTPTSDIFDAPIATTSPPSIFSRRTTHPQPKENILDTNVPIQTNKFYANLFLGTRDRPVFTYPYSVWWAKGSNDIPSNNTWGFGLAHIEEWERGWGANMPWDAPGAPDYYYSPIWVKSLQFSAAEFDKNVSSMDVDSAGQFSIGVNLYADKATYGAATKKIRMNLCLGMGFVSGRYTDLTPIFYSDIRFLNIYQDLVNNPPGMVKYIIVLQNGTKWILYANPDLSTAQLPFVLTITNENAIKAAGSFTGLIQIAKLPTTESDVVAAHDASAGAECLGATVTGQVSGSTGTYQINYKKNADAGNAKLLMYSLIHHYQSFEPETAAAIVPSVELVSPTKGMMKGVVADTWKLKETDLPVNIKWLPVKSGAAPTWTAENMKRLIEITKKDLNEDMMNQTYNEKLYFAGKSLAKYAMLCIVAQDVIKDTTLTTPCITNLKAAYGKFLSNSPTKIPNKLVYDYVWYGLVTDTIYKGGNIYESDFGLGHYNDHHFQYGYFVYAAAAIAYIDKAQTGTNTWYTTNKAFVETFIRDYANPHPADKYFPVSRAFDFFHGHSWAKGLFESQDGKDEESSSEDVFAAYAMKMWGLISGNTNMEARGNLMLGILRRSLNQYMLLDPTDNIAHPPAYVQNRVSGILWENKVAHQTHWDSQIRMIQGIHMIPINPMTPYIRKASSVIDEWNLYFKGKTGNINDGWKGVLYAHYALWNATESFRFMKQSYWVADWIDGGATRAWYVAFAGMLGGAAVNA